MGTLGNIVQAVLMHRRNPLAPMMGNDLPEQGGITGTLQPPGPIAPPPVARQLDPGYQNAMPTVAPPPQSMNGGSQPTDNIDEINKNLGIGFPGQDRMKIYSGAGSAQDLGYEPPTASAVNAPSAGPPMSERDRRDAETADWENKTPEERQMLSAQGKAPVEHSFLKRTLGGLAKGALAGASTGTLGGIIGGAATGAAGQGFFPSANRKMNAAEEYGQATNEIATKQKQDKATADAAYRKAQTDAMTAKPIIENRKLDIQEAKDNAANEYKSNVIALGKQRADDIKAYRDQIIDLKERGADQNDTRIRQLQDRIDETVRHNKTAENLTGENIKARKDIAGSNQAAISERAKTHFEKMDAQSRTKEIGRLVSVWQKQHRNATPEDIAETRRKLEETYGK